MFRAGLTTLPWNGRITWRATVVENQDRVPPGVPETPGYTVYDIFTSWYPTPHLRLDFAITNITDKSYRRHNAVIKEAGRNFKVSLTWKF